MFRRTGAAHRGGQPGPSRAEGPCPPATATRGHPLTDTHHMITGFGGVGTWKGAPDLGEYGWLRSVSAPRKEAPSSEGYKQAPGFAGSRAGVVGHVIGPGRWARDGRGGRGGATAVTGRPAGSDR